MFDTVNFSKLHCSVNFIVLKKIIPFLSFGGVAKLATGLFSSSAFSRSKEWNRVGTDTSITIVGHQLVIRA